MNQGQSNRPAKVGQAVMLLYVTLGVGAVRSILEAQRLAQVASTSIGSVIFLIIAVLGVTGLFVYLIGKGRNWARITFLVLFLIGIPFSVLPLLQALAANPVSGLLSVAQVLVQSVALVFLFQKPSSDWFREMRGSTGRSAEMPNNSPTAEPPFFPVSLLKLALMSLGTFSLYEIYWFYKNWKCVRRLNNEKVNAPIRALFYPLTSYWLFRRIREYAQAVEASLSLEAGLLAISVLVFRVLLHLPDPYWLITFLSFLPLLSVQSVVNKINQKVAPAANVNSRLGGWNIVALVIGGSLFVLAIIGTFLE